MHYWELIDETKEFESEEIIALNEQKDDLYQLHHMNLEEYNRM